jgi:mono/diheme cytochrome c family protein
MLTDTQNVALPIFCWIENEQGFFQMMIRIKWSNVSKKNYSKFFAITFFFAILSVSCKSRKTNAPAPQPTPEPLAQPVQVANTTLPTEPKNNTTKESYASIQPLIEKYCVVCHAGTSASKGVALKSLPEIQKFSQQSVEQIRSGKMPPSGVKKPNESEMNALLEWLSAGAPEFANQPNAAPPQDVTPTPAVPSIRYSRNESNPSGESLLAQHCQKCHNQNAGNNAYYKNISLLSKQANDAYTTDHVATLEKVKLHSLKSIEILRGEISIQVHAQTLKNLKTESQFDVFLKWYKEGNPE